MKRDTLKSIAAGMLLLCVPFAAVAFDSSALPGPAGAPPFTAVGGTVTQPVVFTGDNASGTGTVRIRPSDNDTQLTLCAADNNPSPEVCSTFQHDNFATNDIYSFWTNNGYVDSPGSGQRFNTSTGRANVTLRVSTSNASNGITMAAGNISGGAMVSMLSGYLDSGGTTGTLTVPSTTTLDTQKAITNSGSATCQGLAAGSVCIPDEVVIATAGTAGYHYELTIADSSTTGMAGLSLADTGASGGSIQFLAAGASLGDPDYNSRGVIYSDGTGGLAIVSGSDRSATTEFFRIMDNTAATGVTQLGVYGGGTVTFPQTQTVTCADNGAGTNATQNLDPQAHTITILNNDATGCDVTMQETSAQLGAVAVICVDPASTATNVNLADVANVFNGAAPALGQGDCITIRYFDAANDLWLQTGASNN